MKNAILDYVKNGNVENFVSITNLILDQYPKSIQDNLMNILDTHDTIRVLTYLGADEDYEENLVDGKYVLSKEEKDKGLKLLKIATIMQYTVMGIPTVFYGDECGVEGMKDPYCRPPYPWGKEDLSLLEWYQKLGDLRNHKALVNGDMKIIYAENSVLIYEREKDGDKVVVAINRSLEDFTFVLEKNMCNFETNEYLSGKVTICPGEAIVLI
jgi:glycosidase